MQNPWRIHAHLVVLLLFSFPFIQSQQPYEGLGTTDCTESTNQSNSTSLLGYFCNGNSVSCDSYVTFHPIAPYDTSASISSLLDLNTSVIPQSSSNSNSELLVPVDCSCSNGYYQSNASYSVQSGDTAFTIANNTYQSLSTCQAIINQNLPNSSSILQIGQNLNVPLRCACPTTQQYDSGIRYLITYLVNAGEDLSSIAQTFGIDSNSIMDANELSNGRLYQLTTLLIPVKTKPNFTQITLSNSPPPPPPISSSPNANKSNHVGMYIAIGVGVFLFLLILFIVVYLLSRRRKREKNITENIHNNSISKQVINKKDNDISLDLLKGISGIGSSVKVYTFHELQLATNGFSTENKIGNSVYRGKFKGDLAAIKRTDRDISMEIDMLKQIHHFNLIRLSGLCFNKGFWYLVFEYAENGSLSNWIYGQSTISVLNWEQRLQISLDIANGLNYLHSFVQPSCVHMDIRTSGILLDSNFRAKISNLSNLRPAKGREGDFTLTRHITGTRRYMAPEYLEHGLVSPKIDIYGLGIVILEIITGKESDVLFEKFEEMVKEENFEEWVNGLVDPLLEGNYSVNSAVMMVKLIKWCVEMDPSSRPSIGEVVQYLSRMSNMSTSWYSSTETTSFGSDNMLLMNDGV